VAGLGIHAQVSGLLLPHAREIWVDSEEARVAPGRRRFTIGHELGHWVLHCNLGERGDDGIVHCRDQVVLEEGAVEKDDSGQHLARQRSWYPPEELEANQFGAAMLMPAELVRTIRERVHADTNRLARVFGVSTMAMERRLWFLSK
jgi:Zn-dependent peptidase ImmA (M78 family)